MAYGLKACSCHPLKQFKYFQQNIATSLYIIIIQSVVDVSLHITDVYRVKLFSIILKKVFKIAS